MNEGNGESTAKDGSGVGRKQIDKVTQQEPACYSLGEVLGEALDSGCISFMA